MKRYLNVIENYWVNLKVKSKIILGFSIVLSLLFFFSLIIIWTNSELSKTQKITEYSLRAINNMKDARLNEKDFFLTKELKLIDKNILNLNLSRENFNKILKIDNRKELESKIYILLKYLDYYNENFTKVISCMKERGLTSNEGNLKKIDDAYLYIFYHLKSNDFETLNVLMKLDKLVNQFFDEKRSDLIGEISLSIINFEEYLTKNNYDEMIFNNFYIYRDTFYEILSADNQINGAITEFQEYIIKIEHEMDNYLIFINKFVNYIKIKSILFLSLLTFILITLVVIVSIFTTNGITKPINKISTSTRFIKGVTFDLARIVEKNAVVTIKLTKSIEIVVNLINEQSAVLNESSSYILNFTKNLKEIAEIANNKKKYVERMTEKIKIAKDEIIELVDFVKDIEKNSKIMIETSEMITKVAEQTKVLAINSGIEASNAGEHGKVLKIVAKEIKLLSEKTAKNSMEIVNSIYKNRRLIQNSSEYADNILNHFLDLVKEIELTGKSTIEIINRVDDVSDNSSVILNYIENLLNKNEIVKYSGNEMKKMASTINENINNLISVKSDTHNAVSNIIMGINKLSDKSIEEAV